MDLYSLLPHLPATQIVKLEKLADLFLEWNQKLNLSAIRDKDGVLLKHIVDSLLVMPLDIIKEEQQILDLGTGGGFPGLILAIIYPNTKFTLVDATEKKIKAVQAMADDLNLTNVKCLTGRAEELGRDKNLREKFDVVVARALAKFPTLLEYCLPFLKIEGKLIAYQGPEMRDSWKQYKEVAYRLSSVITEVKISKLPIEDASRCFIVVKKIENISDKYPRKVGLPKKNPLA